ncbi:tetraacyldisaccharide 4'-kinase [Polynucleobacter sp. SHI8]|uniref:tetraacyldisaccharide 4'-kinase n=1 Tax=unclassified Polynucleobacter TaxID=2640945 RepID=UPI00249167CE|nr:MULTISPECIES: tetraacyldisaccharide 4'-kinase [unclassified Polynucleobacter]BDW10256.1 tetraacyldisaccharide 4'-kinase [Polynucleobacter sp. SHI2]BDW12702.1 tetraacyldisaccharide 4'-kinase [Polynucleobacter sp. SHI8]
MQLQAPQFWESKGLFSYCLWPLSFVYGLVITVRKLLFKIKVLTSNRLPVPVIFVGNLRVGGTGKTPCVIALAKALAQQGFQPGVITRGYRSQLRGDETQEVCTTDHALAVGDEALLMAQQLQSSQIPVWIGSNRYLAGLYLLKKHTSCNVIISDDGLQHLALARQVARDGGQDIEIVVRDDRGEGNELLLPAGPLREPTTRPRDLTVNMKIYSAEHHVNLNDVVMAPQSFEIACYMRQAYQLINPSIQQDLNYWLGKRILAVAGIAFPEKFFKPLRDLGLDLECLALEDHADLSSFNWNQYPRSSTDVILMTEKDAVKCQHLQDDRIWVIPLEAVIPNGMMDCIREILHR